MRTKIILIDDDKIVLRTIEKLLTKEGYGLTIVDSGQKALEAIKSAFYDLIITDIQMPQIDGIETIKKIRKLQGADVQKSKFMIITGYSDSKVSKEAAEMGIKHFLTKPFDRDLFLKTIEECFETEQVSSESLPLADNKTLIDSFIREQQEKNAKFLRNKTLPVIGWTNTYVPEEIIMAAGFLPYRITGAPIPLHLSKTYLSGNLCSSVQSIMECALNGDYDFLDGIIIGASTDATKRLYDAWIRYIKTPFSHLLDIPKFVNQNAIIHYTESIRYLIKDIEKYFSVSMNDSHLEDAVVICNKTRQLLTDLNNLRKAETPPVTSQQFLEICKLAMTTNKKEFNDSLESLLTRIKVEKGREVKFRILLTGSFQDQQWLLDVITEKGGLVVCEDFCTRMRYFSGLVEEDADLITAIAKRYLFTKPASANLVSLDQRAEYLLGLMKEFKVDGIIYYLLKFDDPYLFEFPDLKDIFSANSIPVLRIETEHNTSALGQTMTRVQAFIETMRLAKSKRRRVMAT